MTRMNAVALFAAIILVLGGGFLGGRASNAGALDEARSELATAEARQAEAESKTEHIDEAIAYVSTGAEEIKKSCRTELYMDRYIEDMKRCRAFETNMNEAYSLLGQDGWSLEVY